MASHSGCHFLSFGGITLDLKRDAEGFCCMVPSGVYAAKKEVTAECHQAFMPSAKKRRRYSVASASRDLTVSVCCPPFAVISAATRDVSAV